MNLTYIKTHLDKTLDHFDCDYDLEVHRGKVRVSLVDGNTRYIVVTDRISAFDHVFGTIPFKGQILNGLSKYWFDKIFYMVPNHFIHSPDANISIVKQCKPLPVEIVVRGYLTGSTATSIWTAYAKGEREFCGHKLKNGMRKHQMLDTPLVTPSTKSDLHDKSVSGDYLIENGFLTKRQFAEISDYALKLFKYGSAEAFRKGLILVDTKYEFGVDSRDRVRLIDEVHTPDSSRYWILDDYEERFKEGLDPKQLDKEFFRRELLKKGYEYDKPGNWLDDTIRVDVALRYMELFRQFTGKDFVGVLGDPEARIKGFLDSQFKK